MSIKTPIRRFAAPIALLLAGGSTLALATTSTEASSAVAGTAAAHASVLHFVARDEKGNMTVEDLGEPSDPAPGLGDLIAFTQTLHHAGKQVGTVHVEAIGVDGKRGLSEATGTLRLHRGNIQVAGLVAQTPTFTLAVVGGTGRYVGATGELVFDASSGTQRLAVHLRPGQGR